MATISQVARAAGVGIGTVSRVLNDHPAVTEETRERVRAAMAELDYRPSPLARGLKRGTTHRIGVLVSFFTSPSAVERLRGLTQALVGSGYEIVLYPVEDEQQRAAHMDSLAGPHQADGLVLIALPPREDEIARLEASALTIVQVADAPHPTFSSVVIDDVHGGELAAGCLLELGHRELAFVGDPEDNPPHGFTSSRDRCTGFRATLAEAGCEPPERWIRTATHGTEEAARLAHDLLSDDDRPTAVFAASDTQALGVMLAARELGLRIPEDLSVLGFDDVEVAAHVGLSTVRQPLHDSGVLAAELVLRALARPDEVTIEHHELPLETVTRGTTGPASR